MPQTLRVGILGAGWAAESHAVAFSRLPNVEVTALWNRTPARAEALAHKLNGSGMRVYDHWQDLVTQANIDIVSIATPPMLRREPIELALKQGHHLLVEKPISVGVTDARAMVVAARAAETVTAACFNWRYAPGYQVAWRAVQEGQIGQIHDVSTEWRFRTVNRDFFVAKPWSRRMDIGNGTLGEGLSHDLDKARFLTGSEFTRIVSRITPFTIKPDESFVVDGGFNTHLAELSNGVVGNFRITCTVGQGDWRLVLNGDEGTLIVDDGTSISRQLASDSDPVELDIPTADRVPPGTDLMQHTWNRLIADFVTAVRREDVNHISVPHLPSLVDGLRNEEIIAAARRSNDERRWVELAEL